MSVRVDTAAMATIVDPDVVVEELASGFVFTEGPVWHPHDRFLIFSDIAGNRMYRWSADVGHSVYRDPSNMANGNAYDASGRLITCEHATSRLIRTDLNGEITVLASHYDGKELNSPNDVVVSKTGAIYFTDPPAGRREFYGVPRDLELPYCGVYRYDQNGALTLLVDDFIVPNGLCFSLDGTRLLVNDTARRHIRVFDVLDDGGITGGSVWADVGGVEGERPPDGMKIDTQGNVYTTGPGGIHVFDSDANRLGAILFEENVANFAWGDEDLRSLFVTASTSLNRVRLRLPGLPSF